MVIHSPRFLKDTFGRKDWFSSTHWALSSVQLGLSSTHWALSSVQLELSSTRVTFLSIRLEKYTILPEKDTISPFKRVELELTK
ncbi:hypothetical protein [Paenisporosarcina sp.]|uniref:hypothetical protein n=1 Tax=Paenisporosarcina sp. TaxID=1932001 RepID=UPI003C72E684